MSASNSIFRRRLSAASIGPGPGPQKRPWWTSSSSRLLGGGQLEQLRVRRDARGDRLDLRRSGNLQAVRAVVLEALRFEQLVELGDDVGTCAGGHAGEDSGMEY